jgi:von Willebrand factor type A domain
MRPAQFELRLHGQPATVASAALDATPKRILLLVDLSEKMNAGGWNLIASLAAYLVQNARPEDRFALLTFAGPKERLDFNQPRAALQAKLAGYLRHRPGPGSDDDPIDDAVLEALAVFGPPRFGDTILLFTRGEGQGSRAAPKKLEEALLAHRVRLFAIAAGAAPQFEYFITDVPAPRGTRMPPQGVLPIHGALQNLAEESGGVLFSEVTESPEHTYVLTATRRKELQQLVWHMYGQIVEPYRITLARRAGPSDRQPEKFEAGFAPGLAKRLSEPAVFLHPRLLPPCEASPGP